MCSLIVNRGVDGLELFKEDGGLVAVRSGEIV